MQNCVNDFNPLILAIAGFISIQLPIVISLLVNQQKIKNSVIISQGISSSIEKKTDIQTDILTNARQTRPCFNPSPDKEAINPGA